MHVIVQLIDKKSMGVKDVEQLDRAIRTDSVDTTCISYQGFSRRYNQIRS